MRASPPTSPERREELGALYALRERLRALSDFAYLDPLQYVHWTVPQRDWLALDAPIKLFRAGNQAIGKTWAQMAEVIWRATGTHPHYRTRPPPVEIWVICTSWAQSVAIQRKFWELVPKDAVTSWTRDHFRPKDGWGKDNPTVLFVNGSILRFRTTNQGPEALAGATVHYIAIDEPPDEAVYRELHRRVMRQNGQIGLTLTPINKPVDWLRREVERGVIAEVHARLVPENLIPIGASSPLCLLDGTPMDAAWIAEQRRITPPQWAPVVLDGEWDVLPQGIFFTCFDRHKHVNGRMRLRARPDAPVRQHLGFDYAAADREYGHVASLVEVQQTRDEKGRLREWIYVCDEVALVGTATNAEFSRQVLAMLDRNGTRWNNLASVHGDNPVTSRWVEKSNLNTMRALAMELGIPYSALTPRVLNAKDGPGSGFAFDAGNQYLYEALASVRMLFHPRAEVTIKGFSTWDYTRNHPLKDVVDGVRYALKPYILPQSRVANVTVRLRGRAGG